MEMIYYQKPESQEKFLANNIRDKNPCVYKKYLLKVNSRGTRMMSIDVVQVSLFSILNKHLPNGKFM